MNDEDRKFLTEWGGDCWHEFDWAVGGRRCKKCGEWDLENRTFDTWADFGWLWGGFLVQSRYSIPHLMAWYGTKRQNNYPAHAWMLETPEDRCQLICDFLREQEGKE